MTDFDYDVMQKKRIASGDRHRKRGSKTKYCGLPSDHMTQAQWKKKNGEVKTMNLNEPMSWASFKEMSNDLQREYVQKLVDRFHCNMRDFSYMFGVKPPTVSNYFKLAGVEMSSFGKGKCGSKQDRVAFNEWAFGRASGEPDKTLEASIPEAVEQKDDPAFRALSSSTHMDFEWSGDVNLLEVMTLLHRFAGDAPLHLHITAEHI